MHEIRVALLGSLADAEELAKKIEQLLCADEGHNDVCTLPWSITTLSVNPATYPELLAQSRIERAISED